MALLRLMSNHYYPLEPLERKVMLGISCAIWTLCWYSVWKLTTRSKSVDDPEVNRLCKLLRWFATAFAAIPLTFVFRKLDGLLLTVQVGMYVCGVIASGMVWFRIGWFAAGTGVKWLCALTVPMIFLGPICCFGCTSYGELGPDSLSRLAETATLQFGPPGAAWIVGGHGIAEIPGVLFAWYAASLTVHLVIGFACLRRVRQFRAVKDGTAEST